MRKKTALMGCFAIIALMACAALYAMNEEESYINAMDKYNRKEFAEAQKLLAEFGAKYPDSRFRPNVMLKLAELEKDFSAAESIYRQVIKEKPDSEFEAEAVFSLSRLYFTRAEYLKSLEYAGIIMGKFRDTVWIEPAYHYAMMSKNALSDYDGALKLYLEYTANGKYFMFKERIRLAYAEALLGLKKYAEAAAAFAAVAGSDGENRYIYKPDVYAKAAYCFSKSGNDSAAEKYIYELKARYPESAEARAGGVFAASTEVPVKTPFKTPVKTAAPTAKAVAGKFFTVQVGAYSNEKLASDMAANLKKQGFYVFTKNEGRFVKVLAGRESSREAAERLGGELMRKNRNIKSYLVKEAWD